jgi:hypothetical protein
LFSPEFQSPDIKHNNIYPLCCTPQCTLPTLITTTSTPSPTPIVQTSSSYHIQEKTQGKKMVIMVGINPLSCIVPYFEIIILLCLMPDDFTCQG